MVMCIFPRRNEEKVAEEGEYPVSGQLMMTQHFLSSLPDSLTHNGVMGGVICIYLSDIRTKDSRIEEERKRKYKAMILDFTRLDEMTVHSMNGGEGDVRARMHISEKGKKNSPFFLHIPR